MNSGLLHIPYVLQKRDNDMNFWNDENGKLCIVMKMAQLFIKNERPPTVLILGKK